MRTEWTSELHAKELPSSRDRVSRSHVIRFDVCGCRSRRRHFACFHWLGKDMSRSRSWEYWILEHWESKKQWMMHSHCLWPRNYSRSKARMVNDTRQCDGFVHALFSAALRSSPNRKTSLRRVKNPNAPWRKLESRSLFVHYVAKDYPLFYHFVVSNIPHVFAIFIFPSSQVLMQATFGHEAQERAALHEWNIELAFAPLLLLYFALSKVYGQPHRWTNYSCPFCILSSKTQKHALICSKQTTIQYCS